MANTPCPRCYYAKMAARLRKKMERYKGAPGVVKSINSTLLQALAERVRYKDCVCGEEVSNGGQEEQSEVQADEAVKTPKETKTKPAARARKTKK